MNPEVNGMAKRPAALLLCLVFALLCALPGFAAAETDANGFLALRCGRLQNRHSQNQAQQKSRTKKAG